MRTLVWFRGKDLRVADHAPLVDAAAAGRGPSAREEVIPLFVVDPYFFDPERASAIPHRIQYLIESLVELEASIAALGSKLLVVRGKSVEIVPRLVHEWRVDRVVAYRWTEPFGRERDARIATALAKDDVRFDLYEGETLAPPELVLTKAGTPYSVFTPFATAFRKTIDVPRPIRAPRSLPKLPKLPKLKTSEIPTLREMGVERNDRLVAGGEAAAKARLRAFLRQSGAASRYQTSRDEMGDAHGTSRISQDLKFGTTSIRTAWWSANDALKGHPRSRRIFTNELLWRELAYYVLFHHPRVLTEPFKPAWRRFPWRSRDERGWSAWAHGTTGYPVVDASARQLLAEGFVHNRARMISASFLTKHLGIDFRRGEAHYMKWLTDGDWAANDLGWQWTAGCGVDAQPWFRIFNPVAQGEKFDPEGDYVRRWVPELAQMSNRVIHRPWDAPLAELDLAGVVLGKTYPRPIVDHAFGRKRFLAAATGHLSSRASSRPSSSSPSRSRKKSG